MAIVWTGSTGRMTLVGKLVKHADLLRTLGLTTIPTYRDAILSAYDTANAEQEVGGLTGTTDGWRGAVGGMLGDLGAQAVRTLTDDTAVVAQLTPPNFNDATIIDEAIKAFSGSSDSVTKCVVTLGSTAAASTNYGNGTVVTSKTLDGASQPHPGYPASALYANVASELAVTSETLSYTCTTDSQRSGVTEGTESFQLSGGPLALGLQCFTEGSGVGPTLRTVQADSVTTGGDFEGYDATNGFPGWTINSGALGSTVTAGTSTNAYRGTYGLALVGNGSLAAHSLSQALPTSVKPLKAYWITARIKASAAVAAGDLVISLTGTGYTASSTEKISVAHGSLPTSWTLYSAIVVLPALVPSDMALTIATSGTLTNAKTIWLDDVFCAPVVYWAGVGHGVVPGATRFMVGDKFTVTTSNDDAGLIQRFMRRTLRRQWPSAADGSATCANALAT